ncbi:MAG: 16S rRNA processing protein RimM [Firmicutes bacterium]|nr:16S rRNA processing protein RimM [Bacillota bacterium]
MEYVYIGKIVNTHGIKGEIRILSNFDKKEIVFMPGFKIYIGNTKEENIIISYRKHKNFDMVKLKGIDDINEVLKYKGFKVYVNRDDLNLNNNEYVLDDLLSLNIISNNKNYGIVENIFDNNGNVLLAIKFEKNYYIPYNSDYIKEVDLQNKIIYVNNVEELIL